ncbi:hypothetical protein F750_0283 [Streptomyces sp. PAMC 26508]|nr:hypothetical protein F750_0283 [Streptomyces sp. PAMC 26508]
MLSGALFMPPRYGSRAELGGEQRRISRRAQPVPATPPA